VKATAPKGEVYEEVDAAAAADWGEWAFYAAQAEPDATFIMFAAPNGNMQIAKLTDWAGNAVRLWVKEQGK